MEKKKNSFNKYVDTSKNDEGLRLKKKKNGGQVAIISWDD